jgi:FkbM family methyltransferase
MLFIDIGGHIGNYTEAFSRCPGITNVYCFEPNPYNLKLLHWHMSEIMTGKRKSHKGWIRYVSS